MNAPMVTLATRGLWSRRRRLAGLAAAVFLGVAFLTGTLGLGATMSNAISTSFTTAYQGTDAVVRSATATAAGRRQTARGPIDASVVNPVRSVPGVADARGQVQGSGEIVGSNGRLVTSQGPKNADTWIDDDTLNPWRLTAGRAPSGPNQVVIDQGSATVGNLRPGQHTTVYTPDSVPVTVTGIARYGDRPSNGGTTYVAFTLAGAQRHLLGGADQVTQVLVTAEPGVSGDRLVSAIRGVLPTGVQVVTGSQAANEAIDAVGASFLKYFRAFLGVFAAIALLVAALSVHNTFGVVAAQRAGEAALLRAIGATGRQVVRGHLAEAAVLGLAGSLAGVAAGYGMTAAIKAAFAGFGLDLPISGVVFTAGNAVLGVAVGLAVTVLAALGPALRAGRTAPVAALRDSQSEPAHRSRTRGVTGAALTAGGGALTAAVALAHGPVALVGLTGVATLAAGVLGAPVARLRGLPGRLARRNTARAPRRTAATAAALTVGVAIVTLFMVFGASLRASTGANLDQTFTGDLVVTAPGAGYGGSGFSPQVADQIAARPGVAAAVGVASGPVLLDGRSTDVTIADESRLG
ncbi:MAG TPA: ABC transporter permease, partial [Mycobacteriales bacterium]|nr:ABC transporter permease [Mycobacteriales bacterium]